MRRPLALVSTCSYRQLPDNSQSHIQTALNSAANILAKLKEDATSSNPQFSTRNQAKACNRQRVPTRTQGTVYPKCPVPARHIFMATQGQVTSPSHFYGNPRASDQPKEIPTVGK